MERVTGVIKKVISIITKPEMRVLPGQLAFFFVLSIIPLIALIGAIASKFSIPTEALNEYLLSALPGAVSELFTTAVTRKGINFNIFVFFFSAFLLASNGTHSMIITSNEIYKIKSDNVLKRRLKAVGMTSILLGIFLFLILVPVCGDTIFGIIKETSNNQTLVNVIYRIYQIIKYPILRKRRPEDCRFIDGILKKYIKLFSRKRPMLSTLKFALFKYAPSIYKLVVKLKLQS